MADRTSLGNINTIISELRKAIATENLSDSDKDHLEREISRLEQERIGILEELKSK